MKLRFQKDAIVNGINIVMKAVPSKTTMSILECILIDASTNEIKLTGNDMELGIETRVEGDILEHGKIALQTIFSISPNDSNKMMAGELFEVNENQLKVVSLDGHRISIRKVRLKDHYEDTKVIVPGKTLSEVSKILGGDNEKEVLIYFSTNHILFEFDNTIVVSRLIEGEYFRISQMLSSDYETKVSVNKKEFLDCIERATILIRENDKKPLIINIGDNSMELKLNSSFGSMNADLMIHKTGKDIMIGFNPKFLIDALRVIDDEEINIYMMNPKSPCFIKDEEENYIYLILPVNFNAATV